ncbi:uncharacterized protein LOC110022395 [Phalaenopsis equestris]|uniref:uncharacterized protein LOC110022395 n=1 Tax=Phalaenopsis equestris TaxID=78828 RepID=UPI0009E216B9|nr:uncharacterized protein LOC110022395 [Phalaenopsis equestris]XP_020576969.1 uncharacterized protein LOC110022395 [Phalaenopsis equestris]XP_020576970.1 uncharacterized protein LOC110022395 [Phalaenopsis equestris]XP_020576971.1 uncharacterized protein LOC110022395 [Phalaenopsis equestris]
MVMKLKGNGHGSFLNGSRDNYFPADNVDPAYKMFLEHLRKDGKSYILEMEDGNNGFPVFVKYENPDGLSDVLQLDAPISSGYCSFAATGRNKTKKRRICRNSEAQFNGIVDNMLVVNNNKEFRRLGNVSIDLSARSFMNQTESNLVDESYQEFLSYLKIKDGLMVLEYNSIRVIYEGDETLVATKGTCFDDRRPLPLQSFESAKPPASMPANEGTICSDNQEIVLYESNLSPDVVICEADEMSIVPFPSCISSPFALELVVVLSKPYDEQEHEVLWKHATFRKPVLRHKDLRNQSKSFSTRQMGFSYLDHFPDLARKLQISDPQQQLNLLRGLFFWLKNLCHEGAYQPWISASTKIVEVSDHETIRPHVDQTMET